MQSSERQRMRNRSQKMLKSSFGQKAVLCLKQRLQIWIGKIGPNTRCSGRWHFSPKMGPKIVQYRGNMLKTSVALWMGNLDFQSLKRRWPAAHPWAISLLVQKSDFTLKKSLGNRRSKSNPYYNMGPFLIVKLRELFLKRQTDSWTRKGIVPFVPRICRNSVLSAILTLRTFSQYV